MGERIFPFPFLLFIFLGAGLSLYYYGTLDLGLVEELSACVS
jgi:hypothetical protein